MRIGVLALQGAFAEHIEILQEMGTEPFQIRQRKDLEGECDGLVLPGGESTVMGKLLQELELLAPIREAISGGLPVFGTCAGLILLSKAAVHMEAPAIGTMDILAVRNGYGRQLGSFRTTAPFDGKPIPMVFIRAPFIQEVGKTVQVLARSGDRIVAARQENMLATAFHPELTEDRTVYDYFLRMAGGESEPLSLKNRTAL